MQASAVRPLILAPSGESPKTLTTMIADPGTGMLEVANCASVQLSVSAGSTCINIAIIIIIKTNNDDVKKIIRSSNSNNVIATKRRLYG